MQITLDTYYLSEDRRRGKFSGKVRGEGEETVQG